MIIIQKYGVDGYVCNMNWQDASASVVCKQLGYEGGVSLHYERKESGPLFVSSSLDCVGNETSLDQCNVTDEMCLSDFTISSVAGAFCYNSHEPRLRLGGGSENTGWVEVVVDGKVGTVCGTDWNNDAAETACRQMGFSEGIAKTMKNPGNLPIMMSGIRCFGREMNIFNCYIEEWKQDTSCDEIAMCFVDAETKSTQAYYRSQGTIDFYCSRSIGQYTYLLKRTHIKRTPVAELAACHLPWLLFLVRFHFSFFLRFLFLWLSFVLLPCFCRAFFFLLYLYRFLHLISNSFIFLYSLISFAFLLSIPSLFFYFAIVFVLSTFCFFILVNSFCFHYRFCTSLSLFSIFILPYLSFAIFSFHCRFYTSLSLFFHDFLPFFVLFILHLFFVLSLFLYISPLSCFHIFFHFLFLPLSVYYISSDFCNCLSFSPLIFLSFIVSFLF
ncbi:PRSS12 [Acanthosepion pharaonis]|uniref:PRSS12 n=1 Tax=Acanthosepion pharaonis TaxID=158019 RepID=A0A812DWV7_ACAPH|nr:PRSS12 [Sepia pharaonis]